MIYSTSCWCREVELDETIVMGPRDEICLPLAGYMRFFKRKSCTNAAVFPVSVQRSVAAARV